MHYPTNDEWLAGLNPEERTRADEMVALLTSLNADAPISWVRSELAEGIPQTARFLFLASVRRSTLDNVPFSRRTSVALPSTLDPMKIFNEGNEAFDRLVAAGCNVMDLLRVCRAATFSTLDDVVNAIDDGRNYEAPDEAPGWAMVETVDCKPTGRYLNGLHENLIGVFAGDGELQNS